MRGPTPTRRGAAPLALLTLGLAVLGGTAMVLGEEPPKSVAPTFRDVQSIFSRACTHCHGGERPVEGLNLENHAGVLKGGKSGPSVVAGAAQKSPLLLRLRGKLTPQMPLDGDPLPEAEVLLVEAWIQAGAPGEPKPVAGEPAPAVPAAPPMPKADEVVTWRHVGPILRANCVRCHQPRGIRGAAPEGIRLDGYAATIQEGERATVLPGRPESSPLLRAVQGKVRKRMPLDGPPWLPDAQVELLRRWIADGARAEDGKQAAPPVAREVRLYGVYDGVSAVDGVDVGVDAGTRIDKEARRGTSVEVRAIVAQSGALRATRIRPRDDAPKRDDRGGRKGDDD